MEGIPRPHKEAVLEDLLVLKKKVNYNPFCTTHGICTNVSNDNWFKDRILYKLFKSWPEYSGSSYLPVHTDKKLTTCEQFNNCLFKFNPLTKYGRARRRLLNHCIETLRNDLFTL